MSKQGMRSRMAAIMGAVGATLGFGPRIHSYPDPVLGSPESRRPRRNRYRRKNDTRPMIKRGNLGPPPCDPGTVTYHDKCVRYYGRKKADQFHRDFQHKNDLGVYDRRDRIPTAANFAAMTPWAWRVA